MVKARPKAPWIILDCRNNTKESDHCICICPVLETQPGWITGHIIHLATLPGPGQTNYEVGYIGENAILLFSFYFLRKKHWLFFSNLIRFQKLKEESRSQSRSDASKFKTRQIFLESLKVGPKTGNAVAEDFIKLSWSPSRRSSRIPAIKILIVRTFLECHQTHDGWVRSKNATPVQLRPPFW